MAQQTVTVAMWRVNRAARFVPTAIAAHRESVPGVRHVEMELAPRVASFIETGEALAAFESQRKIANESHTRRTKELRQRVMYWLTYVRMDVPGYEASDMPCHHRSADALIERAQRLLNHIRLLPLDTPRPHYAVQLVTELSPLLDQAVKDRDEASAMTLERTRLQRTERDLMAPVYRNIVTLRALLRNALGATHSHVRALSMDPPRRTRRKPTTADEPAAAPTTARRSA